MCKCVNVEIGSYDNQLSLGKPPWSTKEIFVDNCLANEIKKLWEFNIQTMGCCCGHNKLEPMINVLPKHHGRMVELGYKYSLNEFNVVCYEPKSLI